MGYTYYHGSTTRITDLAASTDICLVDNSENAAEYVYHVADGGHLHTIDVPQSIEIADEDDLRRVAAEAMDFFDPEEPLFFAADNELVRKALAAEGFDAVEYNDQTADGTGEHECLRVWNTHLLTITNTEEI